MLDQSLKALGTVWMMLAPATPHTGRLYCGRGCRCRRRYSAWPSHSCLGPLPLLRTACPAFWAYLHLLSWGPWKVWGYLVEGRATTLHRMPRLLGMPLPAQLWAMYVNCEGEDELIRCRPSRLLGVPAPAQLKALEDV